MTTLNTFYKLHPHARILTSADDSDTIILIQLMSGLWIRMSTLQYSFIQEGIIKQLTAAQIIAKAKTPEELEILEDMFHQLKACEFIIFDEPVPTPILSTVYLSITNKCNLHCIHCCQDSGTASDKELTFEEICQVIDILSDLNITKLIVTGGEPLVRSDFTKIINYITSIDLEITLMTNGTLIDEEMAQFIHKNIAHVNISLDGYNQESTDTIRGKGTFEKVIAAVHRLQHVGVKDITLSMVLTQENIHYKKEFIKLCQELNVTDQFRLFQPLGRGKTHSTDLDVDLRLFLANPETSAEYRQQINCKNLCGAGSTTIFINEKGDIYPCTLINTPTDCIGNILTDKAWIKSDRYIQIISKLQCSIVDQITECKDCDIRYFCVNGCPAVDRLRFLDEDLRKRECTLKKSFYQKIVWS